MQRMAEKSEPADVYKRQAQLPRDVREDMLLFQLLFQLRGPEAPGFEQLQRGLRLQKAVDVRQLPEPREQALCRALADGGTVAAGQEKNRFLLRAAGLFRFFDRDGPPEFRF